MGRPVWDEKIAKAYGCNYSRHPARAYLDFMRLTRGLAERLADALEVGPGAILKTIDEYNYAKYTKRWV